MREEIDYGGPAVAKMVREFWEERNSEVIFDYQQRRTLSEVLVDLLNGETLTTASKEMCRSNHPIAAVYVGILIQLMEGLRDYQLRDTIIPSFIQFNSELNERLLRYRSFRNSIFLAFHQCSAFLLPTVISCPRKTRRKLRLCGAHSRLRNETKLRMYGSAHATGTSLLEESTRPIAV